MTGDTPTSSFPRWAGEDSAAGPVIHEANFLLGMYTAVLVDDFDRTGGFPAVLSVEPLFDLMHQHGIYPGDNGRFLNELYGISEEPRTGVR